MSGSLVLMPNALDLGTAEVVPLQDVLPLGVIRRAAGCSTGPPKMRAVPAPFSSAWLPSNRWWCHCRPWPSPNCHGHARAAASRAAAEPGRAAGSRRWPGTTWADLRSRPAGRGRPRCGPGGRRARARRAGAAAGRRQFAAAGAGRQRPERPEFAFVGYLPQEAPARAARLRSWKPCRAAWPDPVVDRNALPQCRLLAAPAGMPGIRPTRAEISCGLTLPGGWTRTDTVARWRESRCRCPTAARRVRAF
jgi:16S rRNA (cytidine1402-2'-O)-methyltransferase